MRKYEKNLRLDAPVAVRSCRGNLCFRAASSFPFLVTNVCCFVFLSCTADICKIAYLPCTGDALL